MKNEVNYDNKTADYYYCLQYPYFLNFRMETRYLIVFVTNLKAEKEIFNKLTVKLCQCV